MTSTYFRALTPLPFTGAAEAFLCVGGADAGGRGGVADDKRLTGAALELLEGINGVVDRTVVFAVPVSS